MNNALPYTPSAAHPENFRQDCGVFPPLTKEGQRSILDVELNKIRERLSSKGITFDIAPDAREFLVEKSFQPEMSGSNIVRRMIQQYIEDQMLEQMLMRPNRSRHFSVVK